MNIPVLIEEDGVRRMVDRSELEVKDVVFEEAGGRTVATEYYLAGKLVKRSVWHDMFVGASMAGEQGKFGG